MRNKFLYRIKNKRDLVKKLIFWSRKFSHTCLLDSNDEPRNMSSKNCHYSFLLAIGAHKICSPNNNSFNNLKQFYEKNKDWMFGYFAYDLKNENTQLNSGNIDNLYFHNSYFFVPKTIFKLKKYMLYIETFLNKQEIDSYMKEIENQNCIKFCMPSINLQKRESKKEYIKKIEGIKNHIQKGDVYEMNYCQEFYSNNVEINVEALFYKLNKRTKSPFASFLHIHDKYVVCTSPERFLKKTNQILLSQPIKGTIKRSEDVEIDKMLVNKLLNSKKDKIENVMITDLVRNDLSKCAVKKSVSVDELFGVYTFKQVHHMITSISSELDPNFHFINAIKGAFPMGSMTGAPKQKAMELIEFFETTKRGLFSGSIGYITPNANFDFNVVIRSLLYNSSKKYLSVMVGGAITSRSVAEDEYDECLIKLKEIFKILSKKIVSE